MHLVGPKQPESGGQCMLHTSLSTGHDPFSSELLTYPLFKGFYCTVSLHYSLVSSTECPVVHVYRHVDTVQVQDLDIVAWCVASAEGGRIILAEVLYSG